MEKLVRRNINKKPVMVLDQLAHRFSANNVPGSGAQLTYFLILSIFPFLMVLLNVISYTPLGKVNVIMDMIQYMPTEVQDVIKTFHDDITSSSSQGFLSIAAIAGLWTASSGVKAVISAINRAYDYAENRSFIKLKAMSLLFTVILIFVIIIVFITLVVGELVGTFVSDFLGIKVLFITMWNSLRFIIPLFFTILTFALLYKYSPNINNRHSVPLKNTLPGAIFASLGWLILSLLFSFYVSNFGNFSVTYGSLGGVIIMLIWLFISSIAIVLGGELNATLECLKLNDYKPVANRSVLIGFINKHKKNDPA